MVSVYPNPPPGQDYYGYYPMGGDPTMMRTAIPGLHSLQPNGGKGGTIGSSNSGLSGAEDPSKKVRKPYTITKSRESWTEQEHDKFLEALQLFDRDWKKIEAFVGSKTVIQIRSHAQKYFLKVQKSGKNEHVPPPRPKRKASHPYPHKAPKNAVFQASVPSQSSNSLVEPGYVIKSDSLLVPGNSIHPAASALTYSTVPAVNVSHGRKENMVVSGGSMSENCSSNSGESSPRTWLSNETNYQQNERQAKPSRAMPDFAQVYRFIGSVFDPNASNHLQKLRKMDPIDVETVLTLMKNLSDNLISSEFEGHRKLLSANIIDGNNGKTVLRNLEAGRSHNAVASM